MTTRERQGHGGFDSGTVRTSVERAGLTASFELWVRPFAWFPRRARRDKTDTGWIRKARIPLRPLRPLVLIYLLIGEAFGDGLLLGGLAEQDLRHQQQRADDDGAVGHVESRPGIFRNVEVEEVDHLTVHHAVPQIAERAAHDERKPYSGGTHAVAVAPE